MIYKFGDLVVYKGDLYRVSNFGRYYQPGKLEYSLQPTFPIPVGQAISFPRWIPESDLRPYVPQILAEFSLPSSDDTAEALPTGNKSNGCTCGAYITSFPDFHYDWCPKWKK